MESKLKRLNLELTNICNYSCIGCPTDYITRQRGFIDINLYKKIFNEVGNKIDKIFLWGYGESFIHPKIIELLEYTKDFSVRKVMSTNGSKLKELSNIKCLNNLDELIISINGITQDIYSIHQKGGNLKEVIEGVEKIYPTIVSSKTTFVMQVVANKMNIDKIEDMKNFAKRYGFDIIKIKSFNVMDNKKETFDKFVPIKTKYSRYFDSPNTTQKHSNLISPCEEWMVINWDGSVNPCCWDYFGKEELGNVSELGVYNIWKNKKTSNHRDRIKNGKFYSFCIDCTKNTVVESYNLTKKGEQYVKTNI